MRIEPPTLPGEALALHVQIGLEMSRGTVGVKVKISGQNTSGSRANVVEVMSSFKGV